MSVLLTLSTWVSISLIPGIDVTVSIHVGQCYLPYPPGSVLLTPFTWVSVSVTNHTHMGHSHPNHQVSVLLTLSTWVSIFLIPEIDVTVPIHVG